MSLPELLFVALVLGFVGILVVELGKRHAPLIVGLGLLTCLGLSKGSAGKSHMSSFDRPLAGDHTRHLPDALQVFCVHDLRASLVGSLLGPDAVSVGHALLSLGQIVARLGEHFVCPVDVVFRPFTH